MAEKFEMDMSLSHHAAGEDLFKASDRQKLARSAWLNAQINPTCLYFFQDGQFSRELFQEAVSCFIDGYFIATIVLAFAFIERSIAGRLSHCGDMGTARKSSQDLLKEARNRQWLSANEYASLDELRERRNPVTHFREHEDENRPESRAKARKTEMSESLEADGQAILDAAIKYMLNKTSL